MRTRKICSANNLKFLFAFLVSSLLVACTLRIGVVPEVTPTPDWENNVIIAGDNSNAGVEIIESPTVNEQPDFTETITPVPKPIFTPDIVFSPSPEASQSQLVFPFGIPQIYAIWSYANMHAGLTIHREWYKDGELWIVREEPWDFEEYGASGTVTDVSIYDFEEGLDTGLYQLRLFIDGQEQALGQGESYSAAFFEISQPNQVSPKRSPDKRMVAIVKPPGTLQIEDEAGVRSEILAVEEISSFTWHPDSEHIIYSRRDRSGQSPQLETIGILDELWVVNVITHDTYPVTDQSGQPSTLGLHDPQISPDGRYLAAIDGSGWIDACYVQRKLWIKEITFSDGRLIETYSYYQHDFEPFELPENEYMYIEKIFGWESPFEVKVELKWTCTEESLDGIYLLDMTTLTAKKIEE